ncbi:MAG: hypothetical protein DMD79_17325 [Candidatus Rokuibacteriota bacterium]|nr:MAG: hypothetical protein DMD79_17325 [Candidatus Rokubacteria bacterium]
MQSARVVLAYLFPVGSVSSRGSILLVSEEAMADTPQGVAAAVRELLQRIVGDELARRLRHCEQCGRWMVARYQNKIRCGPACHNRAWTRPRRRAAAARRRRR